MPKSLGAFRTCGKRCRRRRITQHMKQQCRSVIGGVSRTMPKKDPGALQPTCGTTQSLDHDGPTICGESNGGSMSRRPVG